MGQCLQWECRCRLPTGDEFLGRSVSRVAGRLTSRPAQYHRVPTQTVESDRRELLMLKGTLKGEAASTDIIALPDSLTRQLGHEAA